ncbi:MAG TPA: UDP-N-acetylmuramoyl-L-alanine--D-glutamate ligase [Solirubrobacteraceae bacterium]|nr:UDP-N-acetylmuramoyl-L-alanine--D-glutamate ligase [Solirubrobacteraceae bacterium]
MKPRPAIPAGPYLVVGLARSGVAAALALRARGEQVIGLDAGSPPGASALAGEDVDLHLEDPLGVALLDRVGAVVKSPGVPASAPAIVAARERGMTVMGELELAWRLLGNEFVAVTGTNGKTTTVELIGHIHREAGLAVAVAGNVGTALSSLVGELDDGATVVCEASSFQLEDTLRFAPEAAVLLNITPDHLDRHGTLRAYAAAKLELFSRQGEDDVAVLPSDLRERLAWAAEAVGEEPAGMLPADGPPGRARRVEFGWDSAAALFELDGQLWWQGRSLIALAQMRLRGRHNVENAMAAAAVCLARGLDPGAVRAGLESFPGVAHRLEEVAERDGVLYVNDSKATNVASTLVALEAFAGRPLHLILGGQGKGQDFTALREPVQRACAGVYLIGEDAPALAAALGNVAPPVLECGDLERALAAARLQLAGDPGARGGAAGGTDGPVVLLSPACASFDQFADFEARGERFRELTEKLQG